MRILAACSVWMGGAGHFLPLVPFLDQARRDGGQTLVLGPLAAEGMARATGHPFLAYSELPKPKPKGERLPGRLAERLEVIEPAVRDWRPDVVLREPFDYASAEAAARLGVPAVQVGLGLAGFMWEHLDGVAPKLEGFRNGLVSDLRWSPFLTRLPASMDASPFPATWRYREPAAAPDGALPAWWADRGAPLVYVSFGTVYGRMPVSDGIYRTVIDAVAGLDARVLVTVGRDFDLLRLRDVPGNVHVESWVDQADVLGEAALTVCHGGAGTTYGALAAGVPLVIIPASAEQFANATAVAMAGAGVQVPTRQDAEGSPVSREDAPRIRQSIETVLADGSYRQAAQAVAAEMAAAPAIETLLGQLVQRR